MEKADISAGFFIHREYDSVQSESVDTEIQTGQINRDIGVDELAVLADLQHGAAERLDIALLIPNHVGLEGAAFLHNEGGGVVGLVFLIHWARFSLVAPSLIASAMILTIS